MKKAALFILILALAASAAGAQEQGIETTISGMFKAWESMNADVPKKFYTDDTKAVYFDIVPLKYTGWKEYRDGVEKFFFATYSSLTFTDIQDLNIHQEGRWAWVTATWKADGVQKSGKKDHFEGRYTGVLKKMGREWKIVHEHTSVPTS